MARGRTTSARIIRPPRQTVTVNGSVRRDIECSTIIVGGNLQPATATLIVPQAYAGDSLPWLEDAEVVVTIAGRTNPVFRGYVLTDSHRESAGESRVSVRAVSPLGLMDRVTLGQGVWQATVRYFRLNRVTGLPSGWNLVAVLQDWFALPVYPEDWKEVIDIGDVEALALSGANIPFQGLRFAVSTYLDALRTIMANVPQLGIRERFTPEKTFLDFYLRGDAGAAARQIVAPTEDVGPEQGALLSAFVRETDVGGIYSRVMGYGRPTKTQITIGTRLRTDEFGEPWDAQMRLRPMWPSATSYETLFALSYTAAEAAVIADPSVAIEGSPQFDPALQYVFRRFALPDWFRQWVIEQRNVFRTVRSDLAPEIIPEEHIGIQVFVSALTYTDGDGEPVISSGAIDDTRYRLIQGARLTEEGVIELPQPALDVFFRDLGEDGDEAIQYDRVHLFVTLTISKPEQRPFWDTGVRGSVAFTGLEDSGLVLSYINESAGYERIATLASEFVSIYGSFDFGSAWYDPQTDAWEFAEPGSSVIVEDDLPFLAYLSNALLSERNRRRTDATVRIPACLFGYQPGDIVTLENRGINGRRMTVNSVVWNLLDPTTEVSASDQVVMMFDVGTVAAQSGGAGRGMSQGNFARARGVFNQQQSAMAQEAAFPMQQGRVGTGDYVDQYGQRDNDPVSAQMRAADRQMPGSLFR